MKFSILKLVLSFFLLLAIICDASAKKPFRVGVKAGFPNIASVNAEYVLPVMGGRIAPMVDFSSFKVKFDNIESDFTYLEAGLNFYIAPNGKWAYGSISYINMKTDLTYSDLVSIDGQTSGGTASTEVKLNSLAFKVGAKLGGFFYVRPEIGLLVNGLNDEIDITAEFMGFTEQQTEELPAALKTSLMFSFGFGFAF